MIKKIWLPTKLPGLENIYSYLDEVKTSNPKLPTIELDFPKHTTRELSDFMKVKDQYHGMISLLSYDMGEETLKDLKHLEAISNYSVGYNNVSTLEAKRLNIPYGHTPRVLDETTADTALCLAFMCIRNIPYAINDIKNGQWKKFELIRYNSMDPRDLKVGIIGLGRIGETFARKCYQLWQVPIYVMRRASYENKKFDFPIHFVEEKEFYSEVNLLSLHCPLTSTTENMINKGFISKFRNPFIFINTARGAIHCEDDLKWALEAGKIISLGLDVTHPEPMSDKHPLLKDNRAIVLPHIGSATTRTRSEMTYIALKNIIEVLWGNPMPHRIWH